MKGEEKVLYVKITSAIIFVFFIFLTISALEYTIIVVAGLFSKQKKFPKRKEKLRYGVIICARNEEKVIAQLVESIRKSNYPQEKIDVFVMAHNCTDKTADIARSCGYPCYVYEYKNSNEKTKGYALKKVFQYIENDYGIQNYDGFHVFDADNVLDSEYLDKMNDAFLFYDKKNAITSFRNSKNFGANAQTACYGLLYTIGCPIESNGRMALNGSARILGSGFLVSSEMVKDGWNIVNLSDDTDFTIEQILKGHNVKYCDEAMYYDEHPTTFKEMWRQRLRWAKGTAIVCNKRFKSLCKAIFCKSKDKVKNLKGPSFDVMCAILPIGALGILLAVLDVGFKLFIPLFGVDSTGIWVPWLIRFVTGYLIGCLGVMLLSIVCYVKEKDRITNVSKRIKIQSVLLFPLFALLLAPIQIVAYFSKKNFVWTQIEHSNCTDFNALNAKLQGNDFMQIETAVNEQNIDTKTRGEN